MILSKPLLISFEYIKNLKHINNIIDYINKNSIDSVSISNIIPTRIIKKIKSKFISIDIDIYELNGRNISYIKKYNNITKQIRIILWGPFDLEKLNNILSYIDKVFTGSKIFVYAPTNEKLKDIDSIIKLSKKNNFIPSILPIFVTNKNILVNKIMNYKKDISKDLFFIDSPEIENKITGKDILCPISLSSFHIDKDGNISGCKFDNAKYGRIDNLFNISKINTNLTKKNSCIIENQYKKSYDILGNIYDTLIGEDFQLYNEYYNYISTIIKDRDSILDIGCGTGTLLNKLKLCCNNLYGIDSSETMVNIAKNKIGKNNIFLGNIEKFDLKKRFNIITCTFDTINYITKENDLDSFFHSCYFNLKKGGKLIFDMNYYGKYKSHFNINEYYNNINGSDVETTSSFSSGFWKYIFKIYKGNDVFIDCHFEKFYSVELIKEKLKESGFKLIEKKYGTINNNNNLLKRYFFIAEKI